MQFHLFRFIAFLLAITATPMMVAAESPGFQLSAADQDVALPEGVVRKGEPAAFAFSTTPVKLSAEKAAQWLPKKAITVEAWVRVNKPVAWSGFIGCLQDNGSFERGWVLGCQTNCFYFGLVSEAKNRFTYLNSNTPLVAGEWYHVVGTYDGVTQRIFVDGVLAGESKTQSGAISYPERLLPTVGAYVDDNDNILLKGDLESVAVWSSSLEVKEVARRFEARKSLFPGIETVAESPSVDLNWPTYRHDAQRSGAYPRDLKLPLQTVWVHHPQHAPKPAWPGTAASDFWRNRATPEEPLVDFDKAYHVVSANNRVLFGTSADDRLVCLDLQTGDMLWQFFAEGPIRLAPTIAGDRVLFGSDDGFIYCLSLVDGDLIWRQSAVEDPGKRRPGNSRMIGKYPVRSGVMVRGDAVYYAAGLFPKQGVWHGALNLKDGARVGGKSINASVQGYLLEQNGKLSVPTGRHPAGVFLQQLKRRGKIAAPAATAITDKYPFAFISTPHFRFVGGEDSVAALDGETGESIWQASVKGRVLGLAIADETLLASTDTGATYAFRWGKTTFQPNPTPTKPPAITPTAMAKRAAEIIQHAGRNRGYALVVGDEVGAFTLELGRQSELQVIGIGLSPESLARQRRRLAEAGLYGQVVLHDASFQSPPYIDRVFNLIVASPEQPSFDADKWIKLLRPGGRLFVGDDEKVAPTPAGGGSWSHLYGDAGNTACSQDTLSTNDLKLQWFGEPGPQKIIDRHLRAMAPVAKDGLMFVPGNDYLYGVDAFNGAVLWEKSLPDFRRIGVLRGGGSLAVGEESLFAAVDDHCLVLDRITGQEQKRLALPKHAKPREWGYLAVLDDTVIGTAVGRGGVYRTFSRDAIYAAGYGDNTKITVSNELFAFDTNTGKPLWSYQPQGAIFDPAIAVNDDYVLFLESRSEKTLNGPPRSHYRQLLDEAGGEMVALERKTGKVAWRHPFEKADNIQTLYLSCTKDAIVVGFSHNKIAEGAAKATVHYVARVFETSGKPRWTQSFNTGARPNLDHGEQDRHPAIVGDRLIVEPHIYSLASGKLIDTFKRGYGCGTISASAGNLFFRSGNPASYSLAERTLTPLNAVSRPGCWINVVTSDGLVLIPEASSGCICKFPLQCSMVYAPR